MGLGMGGKEVVRRRARKRPTQPPPAMTMGRGLDWNEVFEMDEVGFGPLAVLLVAAIVVLF